MIKLGRLSLILAGSILASAVAGSVSAQSWDGWDRDRDGYRDWRDRDRDWDRDGRRDRGWHYGRRNRDRDCYYVRRQVRDRWGDIVVRRYRVCED